MAAPATGSKRAHTDEPAEWRVQPRHFHAGPSPPAAPSDAHAADGPPPAAMLYRHALECIFAFLDQGELALALRVSRGWLAAAQSMASLQLTVKKLPAAPVRVVAASAMGRHVTVLGRVRVRVSLNADALSVVACLMPHLRGLFCRLDPPPAGQPLSFPAALRELEIAHRGPVSAAELNATLRAVGCLSQLESFTIVLPARFDSHMSFAPLTGLRQLRRLGVDWTEGGSLSDAQADELRALPRLHQLYLSKMKTETLRRLLRQPHQLQWQRISLPIPLDDECTALLPQLPSLTQIDASWVQCGRFDWLRGLPNLTVVYLIFEDESEDDPEPGRTESLVAGLRSCTNIEKLKICDCPYLTASDLTELLPRLPRLRELHLRSLSIDSLAFLAQPPMTSRLISLGLIKCRQLPLSELRHVHALRELKELALSRSFATPLDDSSQSLYEPPSLLLPQLVKFFRLSPQP